MYTTKENVIHMFTCFELEDIGFDLENELKDFVKRKQILLKKS